MTEPTLTPPPADNSTVAGGFGLGLLLQLFQFLVAKFMVAWLLIGVTQLIYIIPAIVVASRQGKRNRRKGLIIAACVVALLNAGCWVFVATMIKF